EERPTLCTLIVGVQDNVFIPAEFRQHIAIRVNNYHAVAAQKSGISKLTKQHRFTRTSGTIYQQMARLCITRHWYTSNGNLLGFFACHAFEFSPTDDASSAQKSLEWSAAKFALSDAIQ